MSNIIVEAIECLNNYRITESINDLNELLIDIKKHTNNFIDEFEENINEYSIKNFHCPKCGEPLEIINQWEESRGEMCGKEVYENICKYGCSSCGYIKE